MNAKRVKSVVLREELFALTCDTLEAIILGQLLYWQERVRDFDKFIEEEKKRRDKEGRDLDLDFQNGWMYKSSKQLIEECMLTVSEATMRRLLRSLITKGFISERHNPANKWDKVLQYRVNVDFVIQKVKELGYDGLSGYSLTNFQNEFSNLQNDASEIQNEVAIPKITNKDSSNIEKEKNKKEEKDDLFESCWKSYRRKGRKNISLNLWKGLSEEDKQKVIRHIPFYVESREVQFQKDFERYLRDRIFETVIYNGNKVIYDPEGVISIEDVDEAPKVIVTDEALPLNDCYNRLSGDNGWLSTISNNYQSIGIPIDVLERLGNFFKKLANEGCERKSVKEAKEYFSRWLSYNVKKEVKDSKNPTKEEANSYALQKIGSYIANSYAVADKYAQQNADREKAFLLNTN